MGYLSPEMMSGCPAEEADDIWSLCVLLHEMVTGEHPFAGGDADEVAGRIRGQSLTRHARSEVGSGSRSTAIGFSASMLSAARSARPTTARAFADALRACRPRPVLQ